MNARWECVHLRLEGAVAQPTAAVVSQESTLAAHSFARYAGCGSSTVGREVGRGGHPGRADAQTWIAKRESFSRLAYKACWSKLTQRLECHVVGLGIMELVIILAVLGLLVTIPVAIVVVIVAKGSSQRDHPNLHPCPDCGRVISVRAVTCPGCGAPVEPTG